MTKHQITYRVIDNQFECNKCGATVIYGDYSNTHLIELLEKEGWITVLDIGDYHFCSEDCYKARIYHEKLE